MAEPLTERAAALKAARALRGAEINAAWTRRTQVIDYADAEYVAACKVAEAAYRETLAEIDVEFPEVPEPSYPFPVERYCVASGRPVVNAGDRCRDHGAAADMCATDVRPAQCDHPHRSPNHPEPTCAECGKPIPEVPDARV